MTLASADEAGDGLFEEIMSVHTLHLAPKYLGNVSGGVKETLNSMLLKYSPDLKAIPVAYTKADYHVSNGAPVLYDNPCVHLDVRVRWLTVVPRVGGKATGTVSGQSQEHISLLMLNYFNVTIQGSQITTKFDWDSEERCWVSREDKSPLGLGDKLDFQILNFVSESGVLVIYGSIDKLAEIPPTPAKKTPKKESSKRPSSSSWHVDDIPSEKKEKKKSKKQKA